MRPFHLCTSLPPLAFIQERKLSTRPCTRTNCLGHSYCVLHASKCTIIATLISFKLSFQLEQFSCRRWINPIRIYWTRRFRGEQTPRALPTDKPILLWYHTLPTLCSMIATGTNYLMINQSFTTISITQREGSQNQKTSWPNASSSASPPLLHY